MFVLNKDGVCPDKYKVVYGELLTKAKYVVEEAEHWGEYAKYERDRYSHPWGV